MLSYLTKAKDEKDLKPLFDGIINKFADYKVDIMTYAEHYRQEGQLEMAKELLKRGISEDIILETTHLSKKQIEELKKTLH